MNRTIFLSLGGNIGNAVETFDAALKHLEINGVRIIKRSSCAQTSPVDCAPGTPDFYNMAITAETELQPFELLELTQKTEVLFGRPADHGFHESRTLDIDIIYMEGVQLCTNRLTLPHPRAAERDFVMRFLLELDSDAPAKVRPVKVLTPCPAPMEGVMTPALIKTAAEEKLCTEFLTPFMRISEHVPKEKEFRKFLEPYKNTKTTLQLMGNSPELLSKSAALAAKFDIAGINLNFGCPSGQVLRHNGGGALLKNPLLMRELCRAVRQSVPDLPLSVKMRLGFDNINEYKNWISDWSMSSNDAPDFFIIHTRAVKEGYKFVSDKEHLKRSIDFVSSVKQNVILNGDINDTECANKRLLQTGCASFMTGRGWLKNPYLFRNFELEIHEAADMQTKISLYQTVLHNADLLGPPYHRGKQIELSQLIFAPSNPFLTELLKCPDKKH